MIQNSPSGGAIDRASLNATVGRVAAIATALLLVAFLVLSVSRAAFTADTINPGNSVVTGGFVTLKDNDVGVARITMPDASPGVVTTECINVRLEGTANTGPVKMYTTPFTPDPAPPVLPDLSPYLNVTVELVEVNLAVALAAYETYDCTAFDLSAPLGVGASTIYSDTLFNFPGDYASGQIAFTPADGRTGDLTYAFRITAEVQDDSSAANSQAFWNFVWATEG